MTELSYTVLVRRYQNQGITLPSAPSSPSESSTPTALSGYPDDDDAYFTSTADLYDNLHSTSSQATLPENHRSWSGLESAAYSAWPSPLDYNMRPTTTGFDTHHATAPMPNYAFGQPAQPPILGSNVPAASTSWNWTASMNPSSPMHATSPATSQSVPNPAFYGYNNYPLVQQPVASRYPTYPQSSVRATYTAMANQPLTSMPRPITTAEQDHYGSNTSTTYPDPRYPPHPMYRF